MKIVKKEVKLCLACMEEHEVQTVIVKEKNTFQGEKVEYDAMYEYCDRTDDFIEPENMSAQNYISMKNAKRVKLF